MKSSVEQAFAKADSEGRCAFIPYMTGGFPDPETCGEILEALAANGADVIEVGIPFSDPLADGPTIQSAAKQALDNGTTPIGVLRMVSRVSARVSTPMVAMTYVNPVFRMGTEEFAARAADSGVAGVIVPDLPPEEADDWLAAASRHGLDTIFLVAPTTPLKRVELIGSKSSGFLYYVSMTGVTGTDCSVSDGMREEIRRVRGLSKSPVAVGFGISTPEQASALADAADGVIVGSALVREVANQTQRSEQVAAAGRMARALSSALIRKNGSGAAKSGR